MRSVEKVRRPVTWETQIPFGKDKEKSKQIPYGNDKEKSKQIPYGNDKEKSKSRFPSGMTKKRARADSLRE